MMTEGLNYISVKVLRLNPANLDGDPLLEGSGTLFEDNGFYYVLTAYHCLEKEVEGQLIEKDLNLTRILFSYKRNQIKVGIVELIDDNKDNDWALLSVHQPKVDWSFTGKVKLTNQIQVGTTYESYPYVHEYGDRGRYTTVIPHNEFGDCHIADDLTTGRYSADLLMKGGSGAGVMLNVDGVFHCFGFMKETLPHGMFNDVRTVCVDDIIPLLSKNAHIIFTNDELRQVYAEGKKLQLEQYTEQLSQVRDVESLKTVVTQLLENTIPTLIDSLQDGQALDLLKLVEDNCGALFEEHSLLKALFQFDYSLYYRLVQNIDKARECAHQAFELDEDNQKYLEAEARRLWTQGEHDHAKKLINKLPEDNMFRLAVVVYSAENQQEVFMKQPEEIRQNYKFRYYLLDLYNGYGFPQWIVDGIELKEPATLTLSLLPEWFFLFTAIHCRMQGIIPLSFSTYIPPKELEIGFEAGWRYFGLAKGTKLEDAIPILSALYFYWGFLLKDRKEEWFNEFVKVTIKSDNDTNRRFYAIMQSSMLSMMGKYDDAFKCVMSTELTPGDIIWAFVTGLAIFTQNTDYLKGLAEYSKKCKFVVDSFTSEALIPATQFIPLEKLGGIIEGLNFEKDYEKRLLIDFNKLNSGLTVMVEGYEEFMDNLTGILPAVAATIIYNSGDKERALNYLKSKFEPGKGSKLEETYFSLLSNDVTRQADYYRHLKNKRERGESLTLLELKQYYNYTLTLLDYEEALRLIIEIREVKGDDEYSFSAFIDLLGKCRPGELPDHYEKVIAYPFQMQNSVMMVYLAYATNKYVDQAAEILYEHTVRMRDDIMNNYYIHQTQMGFIAGVANETDKTVSEDKYLAYSIDGVHYCRRISPNTILGAALQGRMTGETVEVELSGERKTIQIDNVYNKYGYLHYSLLKDIMDMGGNDYLHPLKVPELNTPEVVEDFVNQLGEINKESKDSYDKVAEQYAQGENGLFALVNTNDIVSSYYKLLFSSFEIRLKPYTEYSQAMGLLTYAKHRCVLDITSLLLLFEFSNLKGEIKYKERFILPRVLYYSIVAFRKNIPILTSYDFVKAMEEGYLHRFSDNPREDVVLRFDALIDWMEQNCDIVTNPAVLNINTDVNQNSNMVLFQHTFAELLSFKEPHLILTEDSYLRKLMNIPMLIASTEAYIYSVEGPVLGKEFSEFLVKNHNRYV